MIRTKQLSPREVVQAYLDRISAVNPKINAIVTLLADDALKAGAHAQPPQSRATGTVGRRKINKG